MPSKTFAALILGLLMATSAFAHEWATAVSKNAAEDRAVIFRYVSKLEPGFDRSKQPVRVIIIWNFKSESGMPSPDEKARMDELEDALEPSIENTGIATLAIVSTGENSCEWIYYASSSETFMSNLNQSIGMLPAFPIEIQDSLDPTWSTYEELLSNVTTGHG